MGSRGNRITQNRITESPGSPKCVGTVHSYSALHDSPLYESTMIYLSILQIFGSHQEERDRDRVCGICKKGDRTRKALPNLYSGIQSFKKFLDSLSWMGRSQVKVGYPLSCSNTYFCTFQCQHHSSKKKNKTKISVLTIFHSSGSLLYLILIFTVRYITHTRGYLQHIKE